jgi:hypothetical protein
MKVKNILKLLLIVILWNLPCSADQYSQHDTLKEIILEDPYKSARQDEVKYVDGTDSITDNITSIYNKSHSIARNFGIDRIFNSLKKFYENVRKLFLKFKREFCN